MIKMIMRSAVIASMLSAPVYASQQNMENFCPVSRVLADILSNCQDVTSCKNSCNMLTNIIIANDDPDSSRIVDELEFEKHCSEINDSNIAMTKAWANAFKETIDYKRKLENC